MSKSKSGSAKLKGGFTVKKLVYCGVLCAIAVVLAYFVRFPIFPSVPYLEYDMADVAIFLGTFMYGPWIGLALTAVVSVLQGITVSAASGIVGILMHFFATGAFVVVAGNLHEALSNRHSKKPALNELWSTIAGIITMVLVMIPLNLMFTPLFFAKGDLLSLFGQTFSATVGALTTFPQGVRGIIAGAMLMLSVVCAITVVFVANKGRGLVFRIIVGAIVAAFFGMLTLLAANLLLSDITLPQNVGNVAKLMWTVIVPFNAIKAGINGFVAFLLFNQLSRIINTKK